MKNALLSVFLILCTASSAFGQEQCCEGCCETCPNPDPDPDFCPDCGPSILASIDPNDLIPPAAVGARGWIRRESVLAFRLLFENLPAATAPAQRVEITVPLGSHVDYSSFRLGDFGFGSFYYTMPPDVQQFDQVLPVASTFGVNVHVQASINTLTGVATWIFQALDPQTGLPPDDVFAGFLPPNNPDIGNGEGFANFSITPDPASQTFDEIDFKADIIFDDNEPIATPMRLLTIDADAPVSTVSPIVTAPDNKHLTLNWSGTDYGAGLLNYTLFVSEEGGNYKPWLVETDTTAGLLSATLGKTYRIYVIARDSVLNVEDKPPFDLEVTFTPDLIQGGSQLSAKAFLLGAFNQSTSLMKDDLRQLSLLPLSHPYTAIQGYAHTGTETVTSSVFATIGPDAIVDWVLVELRDKSNASQALYSRAALLQRDGDIVDVDGSSSLVFTGAPADDYYVVLRHRNHLGIGTKTPIAIGSVPLVLDFTDGSTPTYGTDAQAQIGAKSLLWSGDANGDGKVVYAGSGTDANEVSAKVFTNPANTGFSPTYPVQGYFREDLNLDGKVVYAGAGTDVNFISFTVFTFPANVLALSPTFVVLAAFP